MVVLNFEHNYKYFYPAHGIKSLVLSAKLRLADENERILFENCKVRLLILKPFEEKTQLNSYLNILCKFSSSNL